MKLWLISQNTNNEYDTYDSAVVAAETEEEASMVHPAYSDEDEEWVFWSHGEWKTKTLSGNVYSYTNWAWVTPKEVTVQLIADNYTGTKKVICSSFNAG